MIATIEKEATEYAHLLEILPPDEHHLLVSSIAKLKNNITHQSALKIDEGKSAIKSDRSVQLPNREIIQESPNSITEEQTDLITSTTFRKGTEEENDQSEALALRVRTNRTTFTDHTQKQNDQAKPTTLNDRLIKKLTNNSSYSPAEKIELELETLQKYFERRRELLSNCVTTTQVAKLLGTSRQTPHDRVKNQSLLAVRDNGQWKFPIWQFDPQGADGVIDGLPEVLKNLSINSEFAKLNWFMRPNTVLDGLTPLEALKQGLKTRVIAEAMGLGGASW